MVEKAEMLQFTRPLYYIKPACRMLYFSYIQTSISSIVVKFHIIKYALRHSLITYSFRTVLICILNGSYDIAPWYNSQFLVHLIYGLNQ